MFNSTVYYFGDTGNLSRILYLDDIKDMRFDSLAKFTTLVTLES